MTEYNIPKENIAFLGELLEKLNKRARKLNVPTVGYSVIREYSVPKNLDDPLAPMNYFVKIEVSEEALQDIKLPEWELAAAITPLESNENLVKVVPGKEIPESYRNADMQWCDHCKAKRNRKDVYIVYNTETGEYAQIGRQCIRDFLGSDPSRIFNMASWVLDFNSMIDDLMDSGYGASHHRVTWSTEEFMNLACAIVRKIGYTSVKFAQEHETATSTSSSVTWLLSWSLNREDREDKQKFLAKHSIVVEDVDIEMAGKVIEWAKNLSTTSNDYLYNLGVSARLGFVEYKTATLMTSAVEAYRREVEKVEYEKKERKESNFIGNVGDRVVVKGVKQTFKLVTEGMYGTKTLVKFEQVETGNVLIWWASGNQDWESDEPFDIKATVKAHEDYKGVKQTTILRVVEA